MKVVASSNQLKATEQTLRSSRESCPSSQPARLPRNFHLASRHNQVRAFLNMNLLIQIITDTDTDVDGTEVDEGGDSVTLSVLSLRRALTDGYPRPWPRCL